MNNKGVLRAIGIVLAFIGGLAFLGGAGGGLTFLIGGIVLFAVNREQDGVFAAVCPYCAAPVTFVNERLHRCEYCGMSLNRTDFDAYRR